jgi:Helicase HerA, central domain
VKQPLQLQFFPEEILRAHTAIFGKTGSGKSTTARDLVEQVVPEGSRVCILDTVKSDWWGITSSADGKKPGLPFTIIGGPHAHLPLSRNMGKALGEMVATGALPLSIIDMADFGMGDPAHFFVDFAQALMRKMKGVLYLVIEEAHELAPKERTGVGKENLGVYWAKKLATAGRTKGLRMVVLSQRVQALHNAVIGSCETVVVHRMTAPADQEPVVKWLKGNVKDKVLRASIEEAMPSLGDGQGYICSGVAKVFELVQFPLAKTFNNTVTPEDDAALQDVKTAGVDVEKLRALLGQAVAEAEANDPAVLKRRIAELERDMRKGKPAPSAAPILAGVDPKVAREREATARREGWDKAIEEMKRSHQDYVKSVTEAVQNTLGGIGVFITEKAMDIYNGLEYSRAFYEEDRRAARETLAANILNKAFPGDGVALTSAAPPKGNGKLLRPRINPASLETISIDVPLTRCSRRSWMRCLSSNTWACLHRRVSCSPYSPAMRTCAARALPMRSAACGQADWSRAPR